MRIVHVTSSLKLGGAETVLAQLCEQLQKDSGEVKTFEQYVLYFHDGPIRERFERAGIKTIKISGFLCLYDPVFLLKLFFTLKKLKPSCIHSLLWSANFFSRIFAKLLKIPVICAVHARTEHEGQVRNVLDKLLPVSPNYYCAVSPSIAGDLQKKFKISTNSIITIPNGINLTEKSQKITKNLPEKKEKFTIGAVGRFVPVKNYDLLIKSFAELVQKYAHLELVFVGYGPLEPDLRDLVHQLNLTDCVKFYIAQPAQNYFPTFDCFVQPSACEGLSIALLEAMSFKLPVIVTGKNYTHDVITHEHAGLVIEPNNQQQLTQALDKFINNPDLCKNYGDCAYQTVILNFTVQKMARAYKNIFDTLVI